MTALTDTELLERVKKALGITGTYQDDTLSIYIDEVKEYLVSAGVDTTVVNSSVAIGVICRGVADLWNYGNAGTELSSYFKERAIQLSYYEAGDSNVVSGASVVSAELQLNGDDVVKNGNILLADGTVVPIDVKYLPELTINTTPVSFEDFNTTVTVSPALDEGHRYIYRLGNGYLPAYLEVLENTSIWKSWDGVSQIDTDGSNSLYILEVDNDYVTYRGGYIRIDIS